MVGIVEMQHGIIEIQHGRARNSLIRIGVSANI